MQQPGQSNRESRSFNELPSALRFFCLRKGERLEAQITHEGDGQIGAFYRLSFSDGHHGIFVLVEGTPYWHEEGVGPSSYAAAVSNDLNCVRFFTHRHPPLVIRVSNADKAFNVWVNPEGNGYGVYYEGDIRFYLHQTNLGWQVSTAGRHYGYVNEEIKGIVVSHLLKQTL